ncbi:hypothetical protein HDU98_001763 [Podochytrium sp. JEL0797]|nr:hypothetical protein HDU98_001763 [Podochytrium sp. JEL0797]
MRLHVLAALVASQVVNAQISAAGCNNLRQVFTAWGFATATTATVNPSFAGCGCSFSVSAPANSPAGATAAATCALNTAANPPWSIDSLTITSPPTTLTAFPAPLVSGTTAAAGFEYTQSLTFTNNALAGSALVQAEQLPPNSVSLDISNNPNLANWPILNSAGSVPVLSFSTISMTGDPALCCPAQSALFSHVCIPATATPCPAPPTNATTVAVVTSAAMATGNAVVTASPSGPLVALYTLSSITEIPYISPISAPGTIVVLTIGIILFVGGFVLGTVMWYTRKTQKTVVMSAYDLEDVDGRKSLPRVPPQAA